MGLKDKASNSRNASRQIGALKNDQDFYNSYAQDEISFDQEKMLDILKKKGKIDKEELFKTGKTGLEENLSRYLLPDDLSGSTQPADSDYSLNSRLEALINLIELSKELALTDNPEELWESLLFNILGQVGAREAAIFIKDDNRMQLKAYKGFIFPENFNLSKRSGIERILQKDLNIHYGNKLSNDIVGDEYTLFTSLQIELVIPIIQIEELNGFILIGKTIGASDYSIEDLLYLKLLGEVIGSFHSVIQKSEIINNQKKIWNSREKVYQKYLYFQQQIQSGKTPEETQQIFNTYMTDLFKFQAYLLFILNEKEEYLLTAQKGLQESSYKNLRFSPEDEVIFKCQQHHTWFTYENLLDETMFSSNLSKEDKIILKECRILPLHFHGNLYGFFILLNVKNDIPTEYMHYAQNIIITYFWYYLSHIYLKKAQKNLKISITDPMHAIKDVISRHEKILSKKGIPYSIFIIQITNLDRLENLFGEKFTFTLRRKIKKILNQEFSNSKFISELFSNKFIVIFEKIDKSMLWIYDKNFIKKVNAAFDNEQKRPLLNNRLYSRPEDKERTLEQLINY
ncbi:MAG: hypothetical protein OEV78_01225 [Spirochaetia bacterium]|nr:hypothetical protein [Spirochaetia bacterium]